MHSLPPQVFGVTMHTIKLKYLGLKLYRGFDVEKKSSLLAMTGATYEVSAGKAAQLLRDFPKDWQVVPAEPAPQVQEAPHEDGTENQAPVAPVLKDAPPAPAPKAAPKKKAGRR